MVPRPLPSMIGERHREPPVRFDVLTLFPGMFDALRESVIGRALSASLIALELHDIREWTSDRHRTVDDYPFGGGPGMVMKPEPLFEAIESVRALDDAPGQVVLMTPQGRPMDRDLVAELSELPRLLIVCGRYEGVDERVREHVVDIEVSAGDVVLAGGEIPAMMLIEAVARRLPGVLGASGSLEEESFEGGLLEYPQYTRPSEFRGLHVPEVLLSGNHAAIERWRREQRLLRTASRRPDLLADADLSSQDEAFLREHGAFDAGEESPVD
jgi:tRNA (guanine37-N1)-methyltransferase